MKTKIVRLAGALVLMTLCSQCASVASSMMRDAGDFEGPFEATGLDIAVACGTPATLPLVAVDLPFSVANDLVKLPADVVRASSGE